MRKLHLICVCKAWAFAIVAMGLVACNGSDRKAWLEYETYEDEIAPVKLGTNYVFVDKEGNRVGNCEFFHGGLFTRDGLAAVLVRDSTVVEATDSTDRRVDYYYCTRYINHKCEFALEGKYKDGGDFNEGLAWVADPTKGMLLINTKGKVLKEMPDVYKASVFRGGMAVAKTFRGAIRLIKRDGSFIAFPKEVIDLEYCCGGKAAVTVEGKGNKIYEYDNDGNPTAISALDGFDIQSCNTNLSLFVVKDGENYGVVDIKGKYLINPQYKSAGIDGNWIAFNNGKDKWGWLDEEGKEIIAPKYKGLVGFGDSRDYSIVAFSEKSWSIVNRKGETVVKKRYDKIEWLTGSLYKIKKDGKWGIVDVEKDEEVCKPQFEEIEKSGAVLLASTGGKLGVISPEGHFLSKQEYERFFLATHSTFARNDVIPASEAAALLKETIDRLSQTFIGKTAKEIAKQYSLKASEIAGVYNGIPLGQQSLITDALSAEVFLETNATPVEYSGSYYRRANFTNARCIGASFALSGKPEFLNALFKELTTKYGWSSEFEGRFEEGDQLCVWREADGNVKIGDTNEEEEYVS